MTLPLDGILVVTLEETVAPPVRRAGADKVSGAVPHLADTPITCATNFWREPCRSAAEPTPLVLELRCPPFQRRTETFLSLDFLEFHAHLGLGGVKRRNDIDTGV
jgi:hypothetical protein